ncbi:MAG: hypothetical protein M1836_002182 [Candelina mexicana]|nr:MAG: hypothetical protein M1836_002182 [Candelina mexicana]
MFLRTERSPEARGLDQSKDSIAIARCDQTELQSPILADGSLLLPRELSSRGGMRSDGYGSLPNDKTELNELPPKRPKPRRSNLSMYAEAFRSSAASLQSGGSPTKILGSLRSRLSRNTLTEPERRENPVISEDSKEKGMPPSPFTEPFPDYVEVPMSPASVVALESATVTPGTSEVPERRRSRVHFRKTVCDYRTEPLPSISSSPKQGNLMRIRADSGYPLPEEDINKRVRADSGYLSVTGLIEMPTFDSDDQAYDSKGELKSKPMMFMEDPGYICDEESDAAPDGFKHTLYAPPVYFPRTVSNAHQKESSVGTELSVEGPNFIHPSTRVPTPSLKRTISSSRDSSKLPRYEKLIRSKSPSQSRGHRIVSEAYEADTECEDGQRSPSMGSRTSHQEKLADRARRYEQIKLELGTEDDVEMIRNIESYLQKPFDSSASSIEDSASSQSSLPSSNEATIDKNEILSYEDAPADAETEIPRKEVIQLLYLANGGKDEAIDEMLRGYDPDFCDFLDSCYKPPPTSSLYSQPRHAGSFIAARLPLFAEDLSESVIVEQMNKVARWDRELVIREKSALAGKAQ